MAVTVVPYETTLTAAATAMGEAMGFLEKISPALVDLIVNDIALHKGAREQRIIDRRMRKCCRTCRREKLNAAAITAQIAEDFQDLTPEQRANVQIIIESQLNQPVRTFFRKQDSLIANKDVLPPPSSPTK